MTDVKICGIKTLETLAAVCEGGARFVGFVFYQKSSRYITIENARTLAQQITAGVSSVGLFVNPTDHELDQVIERVPLDMLQLHGDESPDRVAQIRMRYELSVIKAIAVSDALDIERARVYEECADWLLFDTKAPAGQWGGTGMAFDWGVLAGKAFKKPWMLSGGLEVKNIGQALKLLQPDAVDVSSGVEVERGVKDPAKIKAFIEAVKAV